MTGKPRRPPGNLSHLQRLANAAAGEAQVPIGRYQRWVNTQIISAVLGRVRDEDGEPLFTLKGGAAMELRLELRLGLSARASKDYDAAFRAWAPDMLDALDRALADDWSGFQLQRTEPARIRETGAIRLDIRLSYKSRPWSTVQLEVAPSEGVAGQEIDGVPAPRWIPSSSTGRSGSPACRCATRSPRSCTPAPSDTPTDDRTNAFAISSTSSSCAPWSRTATCRPSARPAWRSSSCARTTRGRPT